MTTRPRFTARLGGFFWLMTIITGVIAMTLNERLVVLRDAAVTAANIAAHETLYRVAITSDLVATLCYLAATVFVYDLLKPVSKNVSLLAAVFSVIGCATSAAVFVMRLGALVLLGNAPSLMPLAPDALKALAIAVFRSTMQGSSIAFVCFGLHVLLVGCLILKSTFLPRTVGVLMVIGGAGWLTFAFSNLLAPVFARVLVPYILIPGMIGEASLTFWLLAKAVDAERWNFTVHGLVPKES